MVNGGSSIQIVSPSRSRRRTNSNSSIRAMGRMPPKAWYASRTHEDSRIPVIDAVRPDPGVEAVQPEAETIRTVE